MRLLPNRHFAARLRNVVGLAALLLCGHASSSRPGVAPVTGDVEIVSPGIQLRTKPVGGVADLSNVAVWLIPLDRSSQAPETVVPAVPAPQLGQHNKSFQPHVLVVQVGTLVQFPNRDPFFHNIFSLFDGKRFDLGLYESGSSRSVLFDRVGVSFLFCNIHAEMSAVVIAVETPYFGKSDHLGHVLIPDVPDGQYQMHAWYERSLPEDLKGLTQRVVISESMRSVGTIRVIDNPNFTTAHKNKYGQDYVLPPRTNYVHP
jgi:plastocyanin